jgi:hypothetical protein
VPISIVVTLTARQQALILSQLRQARYGHLLSLHILFLLHHGYSPTGLPNVCFAPVPVSTAAWLCGAAAL